MAIPRSDVIVLALPFNAYKSKFSLLIKKEKSMHLFSYGSPVLYDSFLHKKLIREVASGEEHWKSTGLGIYLMVWGRK